MPNNYMNNPMVTDQIDKVIALKDKNRKKEILVNQLFTVLKHEMISDVNKNIPIANSAELKI